MIFSVKTDQWLNNRHETKTVTLCESLRVLVTIIMFYYSVYDGVIADSFRKFWFEIWKDNIYQLVISINISLGKLVASVNYLKWSASLIIRIECKLFKSVKKNLRNGQPVIKSSQQQNASVFKEIFASWLINYEN